MPELPAGILNTFLFADIEGSTILHQRLGDRRYAEILEEYHRLLRAAFEKGNGQEIHRQEGVSLGAFSYAREAVGVAVAVQRSLTKHPWPEVASLQVRMGLHTGEPLDVSLMGIDFHRAACIAAAGRGGQILVSDATHGVVARDLPKGVSLRDLGEHRLKDLAHPLRIFQVVVSNLPTDSS